MAVPVNEEVHYIYDEDGQEFVLNPTDINQDLRDILCADGSRAILVDGQYLLADNQTILLQGDDTDLTQYYINDSTDGFVVDGSSSLSSLFGGAEVVQLVDDDDTGSGQQIIYYANEEEATNEDQNVAETNFEGIQDADGNIYPFKRIKLEGNVLDLDEFVTEQHLLSNSVAESEAKFEIDDYGEVEGVNDEGDGEVQEQAAGEDDDDRLQTLDLSKITGRNLITGQTVTLHSYMEKLKKKLKTDDIGSFCKKNPGKKIYQDDKRPELSNLLHKKIAIGKTKSGKKIVGKIIHVEQKSSEADDATPPSNSTTESVEKPEDPRKILIKKYSISKDSFEQISKTLGGVMEMESVRKTLENKNIVVKLVEKKYSNESDNFTKSTSYSYGYMEKEVQQEGDEDKWKFVPDQDTQDAIIGAMETNHCLLPKKNTKFPITTSLTIQITYGKCDNKTIRVNLNPAPGNLCKICAQYFKSNLQLRHHMNNVHNTYGKNNHCEVCDVTFDDLIKLQEHRNIHVEEGKLFICSECNKCFTSQNRLHKHLPTHDLYLRPLQCSVCGVRCASEWALKKHLLTHTGIKPYACDICHKQFLSQYDVNFHKKIHFPEKHYSCDICFRTFSRYSNLLRHTEIHKGSGASYKCDICYCSYNYISSLTRHMVQTHLNSTDFVGKSDDDGDILSDTTS